MGAVAVSGAGKAGRRGCGRGKSGVGQGLQGGGDAGEAVARRGHGGSMGRRGRGVTGKIGRNFQAGDGT